MVIQRGVRDIKLLRLNKFISHAGICSRKKADELIRAGHIAVNGTVVRTIGTKVDSHAVVTYKGVRLFCQQFRYILLNKPKGYVTTTKDPEGRKTVLTLINKHYCAECIYPVGRLDYNTTGLLLLTNDGRLAQQLAHPSSRIPKLYHVVLHKPITKEHIHAIEKGLVLEDGLAIVDRIDRVDQDPCQLGVEIHMGKNRIIRRLFESLGYMVTKLDRVRYANFTKKNIPRGHWIFLNKKQVLSLKQFIKKPSEG